MPNQLLVELYWGNVRQHARAFSTELQIHGALDDRAMVPLWGFELGPGPVRLAERTTQGWRVFAPKEATVERSTRGDRFHRCATLDAYFLTEHDAVRFSCGPTTLVASIRPATGWLPPRRIPAGLAFTLRLVVVLLVGLGSFAHSAPSLDEALGEDAYGARDRAVRLLLYPPAPWHCMREAAPRPRPKAWGCRCTLAPSPPPRARDFTAFANLTTQPASADRTAIDREVSHHLKQVAACLKGASEMRAEWSIGRRGQVQWVRTTTAVTPSTAASHAAQTCVAAAIRQWQFPAHSGVAVRVTAPFRLQVAYRGRTCIAPLGPCPCPVY